MASPMFTISPDPRPDSVLPDFSRWVVVYPAYIDSRKGLHEGRRIAKDKCVERPSSLEIFEVLRQLGTLHAHLETDKAYSRDYMMAGRVRVQLYDPETSAPVSAEIATRKQLFASIAARIPELRAKLAARKAAAAAASSAAATGGTKGKKKNRR